LNKPSEDHILSLLGLLCTMLEQSLRYDVNESLSINFYERPAAFSTASFHIALVVGDMEGHLSILYVYAF